MFEVAGQNIYIPKRYDLSILIDNRGTSSFVKITMLTWRFDIAAKYGLKEDRIYGFRRE